MSRVFLFCLNICMENNTLMTVADMASIKSLLEAACTRGAFRASEMSTVGRVYDKLSVFVAQASAQLQSAEQGEINA